MHKQPNLLQKTKNWQRQRPQKKTSGNQSKGRRKSGRNCAEGR